MSKGIFITGTGTDVGKTYVTALIVKKLAESGVNVGYYKAALSGAEYKNGILIPGDADYVRKISGIHQDCEEMVSYVYETAVSPHLAAKIEGNPVEISRVRSDFSVVCKSSDYVTVEGSGGIVCPIRYDENEQIFLEDIIKTLGLSVLLVADGGLGTINSVVTTCEYISRRGIDIQGIILNNYDKTSLMHRDNKLMIEQLTDISVVAVVEKGGRNIDIDIDKLKGLYKEVIL